jgi:5-methylthioadenosine/S-adenosylhomocysteine deaminase
VGFSNSGALEPGKVADLILVDLDKPHLLPRHNLVANLVHSAKAADVSHVMVDGRWLLRKGEILTLDEGQIKAEAERGAFRLVGQDMRQVREYRG